MRIAAAILAAGTSERFGQDKTLLPLSGKPIWMHSFDRFLEHADIEQVFVVCSTTNQDSISTALGPEHNLILGGQTRQESSHIAAKFAKSLGCDFVLFHDAARPFVTPPVIDRVLGKLKESKPCAPAIKVTDTIKQLGENESIASTPDRSALRAMQTPQGVNVNEYLKAYEAAPLNATDDLSILEAAGITTHVVDGDLGNFKITTQADYERALQIENSMEIRTGLGYDIHRFSTDPSRPMWLGGVHFPNAVGLDGHSDADVVLHAVTDALLGAVALGDIGQHFPNTDPEWHNKTSIHFVNHASSLLASLGWRVLNIDIAVQAETPKIMPRAEEIRTVIGDALGITVDRVSIKATTNEGLGAIGRNEGIAAFATATLKRG